MNTLQKSLDYFNDYYQGLIDDDPLMTPFEFRLLESFLQGKDINIKEYKRLYNVFFQSSKHFITVHYALAEAFMLRAYQTHEKPVGLDKATSWLDALYYVYHHYDDVEHAIMKDVSKFKYSNLLSAFLVCPRHTLTPHNIQTFSLQIYNLTERDLSIFCRQYLMDDNFLLPKKLPSNSHTNIMRQAMRKIPNFFAHKSKTLGRFFLQRQALWNLESSHPLTYVHHTQHDIWITNLVDYAKNRCRDTWIKSLISEYGLTTASEHVPRWKKEWFDAWKGYIDTLNDEQRRILTFIIEYYNPSNKVRDANRLHQLTIRDPEKPLDGHVVTFYKTSMTATSVILNGNIQDEEHEFNMLLSWMTSSTTPLPMHEETLIM